MEISLNTAFEVTTGEYKGMYRVLAIHNQIYYLGIIESTTTKIKKPGRNNLIPLDNAILKNTLKLIFVHTDVINTLVQDNFINAIDTFVNNKVIKIAEQSNLKTCAKYSISKRYQDNVKVMRDFLNIEILTKQIIKHKNFTYLINKAAQNNNVSRRKIIRLLMRLIKNGLSKHSLIPELYRCGSPGKYKIYKPGSERVGRKTAIVRHAINNNLTIPLNSPGMSEHWKEKCAEAIKKIPKPYKSIRDLYNQVLEEAFSDTNTINDNSIITTLRAEHSYPTYNQFYYYLKSTTSKKNQLRNSTTKHNFQQNHRALLGQSTQGVAGPGHTYAIDSSIGDIYLVSSLNRNIIVGRPIHYLIVDVWSGAIVGCYVCLSGPNWEMAKVALFTALYDPEKMAELWGIPYLEVFKHKPGVCAVLLGDRGEYIALAAEITCFILKIIQEFCAPYRGDYKGMVEVKFRIVKDEQHNFVAGTHDARRKEMELRGSNPKDATMTLHEYMAYLSSIIRTYNLTADLSSRLTDYMKAQGVQPTPAGLWDWGHYNGIGYKAEISESELIRTLLPKVEAHTTMKGIKLNNRYYSDQDNQLDTELGFNARNFGSEDLDCWVFPGNIQQIWTSAGCEHDLRVVPRNGQDSRHVTEEEYQDAEYINKLNQAYNQGEYQDIKTREHKFQKNIIGKSKIAKINDAKLKPTNKQNITDNRKIESETLLHRNNHNDVNGVDYITTKPQNDSYANSLYKTAMDDSDEK